MPIHSPVPTARRRRRALVRGLGRLGVLAASFGLLGTASAGAIGAGAYVHGAAGPAKTFSASQLHQGGSLTCAVGGQAQPVLGMSVADLLSAAGYDAASVSSVTVDGTAIAKADLYTTAVFSNNGTTAGVCDPGAGLYSAPSGLLHDVSVSGGVPAATTDATPLSVTVTAAKETVAVEETVYLAAQVAAPAGAQLSYSWSYGDGATSTLATPPPHAYAVDGDYTAVVTVSDGSGVSPRADVVIHVGHPHRTATGTGLGTTNATGSGAGGTGNGNGGTGGGTNTGGTKGRTQPKPAPKPAVRPPNPVPLPGAAAKAATARAAAVASQPVRGILLASLGSPLDLHLSPPPPSGSPGAARKTVGGSSGIAAVLGGIALALAIVGLGGLAERRRVTLRLA